MKVNNGYVVKEIADKIVLIPAGQNVVDYKNMLYINETASFILECMKEDITKEELLNKMIKEYEAETDSDKAILEKDLDEFLNMAIEFGAVTKE